jgi:hypothetical protein
MVEEKCKKIVAVLITMAFLTTSIIMMLPGVQGYLVLDQAEDLVIVTTDDATFVNSWAANTSTIVTVSELAKFDVGDTVKIVGATPTYYSITEIYETTTQQWMKLSPNATAWVGTLPIQTCLEVKRLSEPIAVIGINLVEDNVANKLYEIDVRFNNVGNFANTDLAGLNPFSDTSGVSIYKDTGTLDGIFDPADEWIQLDSTGTMWDTSGAPSYYIAKLPLYSPAVDGTLPTDDVSAGNMGNDYYIVIRTSDTISEGDKWTVELEPGGVKVWGETSTASITTDVICADIAAPEFEAYTKNKNTIEVRFSEAVIGANYPANWQIWEGTTTYNVVNILGGTKGVTRLLILDKAMTSGSIPGVKYLTGEYEDKAGNALPDNYQKIAIDRIVPWFIVEYYRNAAFTKPLDRDKDGLPYTSNSDPDDPASQYIYMKIYANESLSGNILNYRIVGQVATYGPFTATHLGGDIYSAVCPYNDAINNGIQQMGDGLATFQITAQDISGNQATNEEPISGAQFMIDMVAPAEAPTVHRIDGRGYGTPEVIYTNDDQPTFRWSVPSDPDIHRYHAQVDNDANPANGAVYDEKNLLTNSFQPAAPLVNQQWYFRVRPIDFAGNAGPWSSDFLFYVDTVKPTVKTTDLKAIGWMGGRIYLLWTEVPGSDPTLNAGETYHIYRKNISFSSTAGLPPVKVNVSEVNPFPGGTTHNIQAVSKGQPIVTVAGVDVTSWYAADSGVYLEEGTKKEWKVVESSWLDGGNTKIRFTHNLLYDYTSSAIIKKINCYLDTIETGGLVNGQSYFYLVKVVDTAGNIATDTYISNIASAVCDASPPPAPIYLHTEDPTNDVTPYFNWSIVPYAAYYEVQVDDESTFTHAPPDSPLYQSGWITTNYWALPAPGIPQPLEPGGKIYYWRIRCKDVQGNLGNWSEPSTFRLDTIAPSFSVAYFYDENFMNPLVVPPSPYQDKRYARAGTLYLKITCNELLSTPPRFNVDQQGSEDALSQPTTLVSATNRTYRGAYTVQPEDGTNYIDGSVKITFTGDDGINYVIDATPIATPELIIDTKSPQTTPTYVNATAWTLGCVHICWIYDNSPDAFAVNLYRSTSPITTTTGMTPIKSWIQGGKTHNTMTSWPASNQITVADTTTPFAAGNFTKIWNERDLDDPFDDVYEINQVESVSGTTITFKYPLKYDYLAYGGTTYVYLTYNETTGANNVLYYYAVASVDFAGNPSINVANSPYAKVDATPPDQVTLTPIIPDPINTNNPLLKWNAVPGYDTAMYYIEFCRNSYFLPGTYSVYQKAQVVGVTLIEIYFTDLTGSILSEGKWFWRIRARDFAWNFGQYSTTDDFTVDTTPPAAPTLTYPPHDDPAPPDIPINDNTPELYWSPVPDAKNYTLQYDNDGNFTTLADQFEVRGLTQPNYVIPQTLLDGYWYWRVRAIDAAGNKGPWSPAGSGVTDGWRFAVDTLAPTFPPVITPIAPPNDPVTDNTSIAFEWYYNDPLNPRPTRYEMQWSDSPTFTTVRTVTRIEGPTITSAYLWVYVSTFGGTNFVVSVHKVTQYSDKWTESGVNWNTYDGTNGWSTAGGDYDSTPTDTETVSGIGWYIFDVTDDVKFGIVSWVIRAQTEPGTANQYALLYTRESANIPYLQIATTYTTSIQVFQCIADSWMNETSPTTNYGSATTMRTGYVGTNQRARSILRFDTTGIKSIFEPSTIISTTTTRDIYADDTTFAVPSYSDTQYEHRRFKIGDRIKIVDGVVTEYKTITNIAYGTFEDVITVDTPFRWCHDDGVTVSLIFADGTYYWRLRAIDIATNPGPWSLTTVDYDFTVDTLGPTPPSLVPVPQPTNNTNIFFQWSTVSDADRYQIQIAKENDFANAYTSAWIQNNELLLDLDTVFTPGKGCYVWRVRCMDNLGNIGIWSNAGTFRVDTTDYRAKPPPTLTAIGTPMWYIGLSPYYTRKVTTDRSPDFVWTAVPNGKYRLQLDNSYTFTSPVIDTDWLPEEFRPTTNSWTLATGLRETYTAGTLLKLRDGGAKIFGATASAYRYLYITEQENKEFVQVTGYTLATDEITIASPLVNDYTSGAKIELVLPDSYNPGYYWRVRAGDMYGEIYSLVDAFDLITGRIDIDIDVGVTTVQGTDATITVTVETLNWPPSGSGVWTTITSPPSGGVRIQLTASAGVFTPSHGRVYITSWKYNPTIKLYLGSTGIVRIDATDRDSFYTVPWRPSYVKVYDALAGTSQTYNFKAGWNLFAVPSETVLYTAQDIADAIGYQTGYPSSPTYKTAQFITRRDPITGLYQTYVPSPPGGSPGAGNFNIEPDKGYWVYVTGDCTVTLTVSWPSWLNTWMLEGFNLIGWKSLRTPINARTLMSYLKPTDDLGGTGLIAKIYKYNAATQTWEAAYTATYYTQSTWAGWGITVPAGGAWMEASGTNNFAVSAGEGYFLYVQKTNNGITESYNMENFVSLEMRDINGVLLPIITPP